MTSPLEVRVTGCLSRALAEEIGERFEEVAVRPEGESSVLSGTIADQAALRSLLSLIWDTGGAVLSVTLDRNTLPGDLTVDSSGIPPVPARR
jgi:hypothetical protein